MLVISLWMAMNSRDFLQDLINVSSHAVCYCQCLAHHYAAHQSWHIIMRHINLGTSMCSTSILAHQCAAHQSWHINMQHINLGTSIGAKSIIGTSNCGTSILAHQNVAHHSTAHAMTAHSLTNPCSFLVCNSCKFSC
jgi:hypothetical protein